MSCRWEFISGSSQNRHIVRKGGIHVFKILIKIAMIPSGFNAGNGKCRTNW